MRKFKSPYSPSLCAHVLGGKDSWTASDAFVKVSSRTAGAVVCGSASAFVCPTIVKVPINPAGDDSRIPELFHQPHCISQWLQEQRRRDFPSGHPGERFSQTCTPASLIPSVNTERMFVPRILSISAWFGDNGGYLPGCDPESEQYTELRVALPGRH